MPVSSYIVIVMGLPGSGKTFFARQLSAQLSAIHLSSDQIRQEMGLLDKYTLKAKLVVYRELLSQATYWIQHQRPVVLDATFHREMFRELVEQLAHNQNRALFFLKIVANESTIKERVEKQRSDSQADYTVYQQLKKEMEPMKHSYLELESSEQNLKLMIRQAKDYIEHGLSSV
mgnify:CR=1 FL=1